MTSNNRDPAGADRVTALERHTRPLLRIYPADYRRERGEEMLGTLLETTPDGRAWPRLRDVRALAVGGLRARAAQNRRLSTAANLRIAVSAGLSLYLVLIAAEYLGTWVIDAGPLADQWPDIALGLIVATAVLLAWITPPKVAAVSCLAAAVGVYFAGGQHPPLWPLIALMVCVAAIASLAPRSVPPPRRWLWFIGAFAAAVAWLILASRFGWASTPLQAAPVLAFGVVSIAWIGIDARLAVAVATSVLTNYAERAAQFFLVGMLPVMLVIAAIAGFAAWVLRRQSAPRTRRG